MNWIIFIQLIITLLLQNQKMINQITTTNITSTLKRTLLRYFKILMILYMLNIHRMAKYFSFARLNCWSSRPTGFFTDELQLFYHLHFKTGKVANFVIWFFFVVFVTLFVFLVAWVADEFVLAFIITFRTIISFILISNNLFTCTTHSKVFYFINYYPV